MATSLKNGGANFLKQLKDSRTDCFRFQGEKARDQRAEEKLRPPPKYRQLHRVQCRVGENKQTNEVDREKIKFRSRVASQLDHRLVKTESTIVHRYKTNAGS